METTPNGAAAWTSFLSRLPSADWFSATRGLSCIRCCRSHRLPTHFPWNPLKMVSRMPRATHYKKICYAVILLIMIYVMNNLSTFKLSSNMFLHYVPVFKDVPSVYPDCYIPLPVDSSTRPKVMTVFASTRKAAIHSFFFVRKMNKWLSAYFALGMNC